MNQEFFSYLPLELVIDILSRLPIRTIISCKCVCKSWLDLVESLEFAKFHLSKSVPGLAIYESNTKSYKFFEFEDGLDLQHHELHYNLVTGLRFGFAQGIKGSVNGLLFMRGRNYNRCTFCICNPITRDYVALHYPEEFVSNSSRVVTCGFGASKMTGQHKVIIISHDRVRDQETWKSLEVRKSVCHVYTLETGLWSSIALGSPLKYSQLCSSGAFVNGNLHWLIEDLKGIPWISCFDLETELFSTFSSPPFPELEEYRVGLFALGDCLCLSDNTSNDDIIIWLMKEYGVEKSWTKEFVISKNLAQPGCNYVVVNPIKVFEDGDFLMAYEDFFLFHYSKKNKATQRIDMFKPDINAILHTPSFFSLKSFGIGNATTF